MKSVHLSCVCVQQPADTYCSEFIFYHFHSLRILLIHEILRLICSDACLKKKPFTFNVKGRKNMNLPVRPSLVSGV